MVWLWSMLLEGLQAADDHTYYSIADCTINFPKNIKQTKYISSMIQKQFRFWYDFQLIKSNC